MPAAPPLKENAPPTGAVHEADEILVVDANTPEDLRYSA